MIGLVTVWMKLPSKSFAISSIITPVFQPTALYSQEIAVYKSEALIKAETSFTALAYLPTTIFLELIPFLISSLTAVLTAHPLEALNKV